MLMQLIPLSCPGCRIGEAAAHRAKDSAVPAAKARFCRTIAPAAHGAGVHRSCPA